MKKTLPTMAVCLLVLASCKKSPVSVDVKTGKEAEAELKQPERPLRENVLTAEQQAALTPDAVITALKEGNKRFANTTLP